MSSGLRPLISEISTTGAPLRLQQRARGVALHEALQDHAGRPPAEQRADRLFLGLRRELALHQQHRIAALVAFVGHALHLLGDAGIDQRRHHGADHAPAAAHAGGQPVGHEAGALDGLQNLRAGLRRTMSGLESTRDTVIGATPTRLAISRTPSRGRCAFGPAASDVVICRPPGREPAPDGRHCSAREVENQSSSTAFCISGPLWLAEIADMLSCGERGLISR